MHKMTSYAYVFLDYRPLDHSSVELGAACIISALKDTETALKTKFTVYLD